MPSWLNWLGYILGLIGGVIAIVQFVSWLRSRRYRRADDRIREIVDQQLKAEDTRLDAERYEALRRELRHQIELEIPKAAQLRYLENRRDRLTESITQEFEEYRSIQAELDGAANSSGLDPRITAVIRETMIPERTIRLRRERFLLGLVGVLVLLNFLPIGSLPILALDILARPKLHSIQELVFALTFVAAVACVATSLTRSIIGGTADRPPAQTPARRRPTVRQNAWLIGLVALFITGCIAIAVWFTAKDAYEWEYSVYENGRYTHDYTSWTALVATLIWAGAGGVFLAATPRVLRNLRRRFRPTPPG